MKKSRLSKFWKILGPGLVTGSSDDDPSGIVTYSQAGAGFGLTTLWTALLSVPLMASIQEMCARIGMVTSQGLTGTLKKHYSKFFLALLVLFSFPAIILNIGADIAGMGAVSNLLFPSISSVFFSFIFTAILMMLIIYFPYQKIASALKYLCITLLLYLIIPFLSHQNWIEIFKAAITPHLTFSKDYIEILVAILGTTISPYLFFWQATMEAEDMSHKKKLVVNKKVIGNMREDVDFGMFFSNLVMFFIILTTGTILFNNGIHNITTVEQAAQALAPLAGKFSYLLFAIGVIGTGFLAIPVLTGSLSYIISETFGWNEGLDKKFHEAVPFYLVIIASLLLGLGINYFGISPITALFYTAILYGVTSPLIIAIVLHISNNKKVMGKFTNGFWSNFLGIATFLVMTASALFLLYLQFV